jgi:hypothetical protein
VHNKSWYRLQPNMAEDLVYVYTNLRLLAEGKEKDPKKRSKILVIWIRMAGMMAILGFEVHMGERTIAPMPQGRSVHEIRKMNTLSETMKMSTSRIRHL